MTDDSLRQSLHEHLAWWGFKHFISDRDYFTWQRQHLSPVQLQQLHSQVERKRAGDTRDEIAFYDLAADTAIYPALYSQRYEYYDAVGLRVVSVLGEASQILDFGCGIGVLTTFYARRFPEKHFLGLDRSPASIALAQQKADELGLQNIRFECVDVQAQPVSGIYDLIVATHALLQAEQDPGLPSDSWRTFERTHDAVSQASFEQRTGLAIRLDRLCQALAESGRMIVNEKTRQLSRRVPFQRALAAKGLQLMEPPDVIRYQLVEEMVDDGPCYLLQKGVISTLAWEELPERDEVPPFDRATPPVRSTDPNQPLYENHWPSAQRVWEQLIERVVTHEVTREESDGRQVHVELGTIGDNHYLYCANTYDQRQLVIMQATGHVVLQTYYQQIIHGLP